MIFSHGHSMAQLKTWIENPETSVPSQNGVKEARLALLP